MDAIAKLRDNEIAPRKMGLICSLVRGKSVYNALSILRFQKKAGAKAVEKLLLSAISNWVHKHPDVNLDDAGLYIKEIYTTAGKTLKRFRPAPQGRAYRIRKRSNHVTLIVASQREFTANTELTTTKAEA